MIPAMTLQAIEMAEEHLDWWHSTGRTWSELCGTLNMTVPFARRDQAFAVVVAVWLSDRLEQR
jgi:hypothetical protein